MSFRSLVSTAVLVAALLAGLLLRNPVTERQAEVLAGEREVSFEAAATTRTSVQADSATTDFDALAHEAERPELARLPPQRLERENWRRARGYFTQTDYDGYATYGEETLRELAGNGDILALDLFADALFAAGEDDRARVVLHLAAVHGSTAALTRLATDYRHELWSLDAEDPALRRQALGRMLIYAEVAALRGDYDGLIVGLQEIESSGIEFTPPELEEISAQAESIYDDLALQRAHLGMRPFDDETPALELVTKGFMLSPYRSRAGWGASHVARLPVPHPVDSSF